VREQSEDANQIDRKRLRHFSSAQVSAGMAPVHLCPDSIMARMTAIFNPFAEVTGRPRRPLCSEALPSWDTAAVLVFGVSVAG